MVQLEIYTPENLQLDFTKASLEATLLNNLLVLAKAFIAGHKTYAEMPDLWWKGEKLDT